MNNRMIDDIANKLIASFDKNFVIVSGCNGPYDDDETIVRNLSHLIVLTAIKIKKFHEKDKIQILKKMGEYLLKQREDNQTVYILRNKDGKDKCNGVIGHAWVIEALVYLYDVLEDQKYISEAMDLHRAHKLNTKLGMWIIPGTKEIDYTLNHQLWYAASMFELNAIVRDKAISEELTVFLRQLHKNYTINHLGIIRHLVYRDIRFITNFRQKIKMIFDDLKILSGRPSLLYKEQGYHLFNLMAMARIYKMNPDDIFFDSRVFDKSLKYVASCEYLKDLESDKFFLDNSIVIDNIQKKEASVNIYGYPYNVPGFEIKYVQAIFNKYISSKQAEDCFLRQMELTYDPEINIFGQDCHDKNTINYRIYEYYRYLEVGNENYS